MFPAIAVPFQAIQATRKEAKNKWVVSDKQGQIIQ